MLKRWYRVRQDGDRVLLEYGHRLVVLEGGAARQLLPALLPLLDGRRTVGEIVERLGEEVEPAVQRVLDALARAGATTAGPPLPEELPDAVATTAELLCEAAGMELAPVAAAERLERSAVGMAGTGAPAAQIADLLRQSGVGAIERLRKPEDDRSLDLVVAVPSPSEHDLLERLNRASLRHGRPWLPVVPFDGVLAAAGPLVVPRESACWQCVRLRRAATVGYADELLLLGPAPVAPPGCPPLDAVLAGLAATLALRWLCHRDPVLPGLMLALEQWPRPKLGEHTVYRVPRCPVCSGLAGLAAPATWSEAPAA